MDEWQTAQAAKLALYRVVALRQELSRGQQIDEDQQKTVETLQAAVDRHEKSVLDLAGAQASRQDAHATVLSLQQELDRQRLEFKKAVGVLPEAKLQIEDGIKLPSHLLLIPESDLTAMSNPDVSISLVFIRAIKARSKLFVLPCWHSFRR